jgi:hypothetical protein
VLAIAGPLRLADLGWSEFQGDEARILLRAMAALQGLPDALAAHRKVPGEILLSLVFYGQLGAVTELVGRLPFALAGLAGVLAFYELGRRLFGRGVGLLAAVLLAVDGYSVAFGRILQYDSLAFLLGTLGLLCCLRFGRAERPEPGLSLVGSLCLFGALLVSLGSVFFLLPALILAAPGLRRCRGLGWRTLALWCWPAVPALLAALLVLRGGEATGPPPGAGPIGVWSYLGPRLGGGRPYLNHELFLKSANHYLSTVYLGAVLAGAAGAILLAFDRRLRDRRTVAAALVLGCALAALAFGWGQPRVALLLGAIAAVLLVATSRGEPPGRRMALVWAGGPLLVHLFLVRFPGTHWREVFPGLILLAAGPAVAAVRRLPPGWPGLVPVAGLVVLIGGAASYSWVTLVQRWPEYQMSFPQYRHPLDRTSSDGRGIGGVFGVAHHHGWKALAIADLDGRFPGSYATNESPAIAAWYLRRPQGCPEPPAFVFRTPRAPQDRGLVGPVELPSDYVLGGRVVVDGHPTIAILVPPGAPEVGTIGPDGLEERFDRERASPWLPVGDLYRADLGAAAARRACGSG